MWTGRRKFKQCGPQTTSGTNGFKLWGTTLLSFSLPGCFSPSHHNSILSLWQWNKNKVFVLSGTAMSSWESRYHDRPDIRKRNFNRNTLNVTTVSQCATTTKAALDIAHDSSTAVTRRKKKQNNAVQEAGKRWERFHFPLEAYARYLAAFFILLPGREHSAGSQRQVEKLDSIRGMR